MRAPQTNNEFPKIGASSRLPRISSAITTAPVTNAVAKSQGRDVVTIRAGARMLSAIGRDGWLGGTGRTEIAALQRPPVLKVPEKVTHREQSDDHPILRNRKMPDALL